MVLGIIDWGDVYIGYLVVDLVIVYSFLFFKGRVCFFKEYGKVDEEMYRMVKWKVVFIIVVFVVYSYD